MSTHATSVATAPARSRAARRERRRPRGRMPHGWALVREFLFYLLVLIVIAISLFPFYWILRTSLMSNAQVAQGVGGSNGLLPSHLTTKAYVDDFTQQHFLTPQGNSVIVAMIATAITIVVETMAG